MTARLLSFLLLIVATATLATPVAAQTAVVGTGLAACVARVAPGDTAAAMLDARGRFDCTTPQVSHGPGDFWVRATLPPHIGRTPMVLRSNSVWQAHSTLYLRYADGAVVTRANDDVAAARSIRLGAIFEAAVPERAAPPVIALWRVDGSANIRGIVPDARLATVAQGARITLTLGMLYGAFAGLCLALFAHNLAMWVALRHRFQLAYCAMLAVLAAYTFSSSGMFGWVFPELGNTTRLRVNYLLLAASAMTAITFARHFFEPRVFRGALTIATRVVLGVLGLAAVAFAALAPWHAHLLDICYSVAFLTLLLPLTGAILVRAWRLRSNYLWLFALAWGAPIVAAVMRVAANLHLIPVSLLLDNSTLASMAAEALLSSIAIAYRIRLLMLERDEARAQENAARLLADTDPLTGLLNRRAFLREAIAPERGPRLLVLVDIDHFKSVNDTLGHDGGDDVLRRFTRALRAAAPAGALVARLGGEEFAILADAGDAALPDAILTAIRHARMPFDLTVTASLGSAVATLAAEADWSRLYRAADQALFDAKKAGRDRARWAPATLAA